jgi:hypothetical protein
MQPSPETTLAIIIGASAFPNSSQLGPNDAFQHSARDLKGYLLDKDGFALPVKNLLDLFDSPDAPSIQNAGIKAFLTTRIEELEASKVAATDLILYYVGHGGFYSPGDQYFLALQCTEEGSEGISGYPIQNLANTLKEFSRGLRRYLILDCCFSAAAYQAFQSGPLEVARQKTRETLPAKGTALLCASGPRDPAKAPKGLHYTMFSTALLETLKKGSTDLPERISFHDLGQVIRDVIAERFPDRAVRPQILSPDQTAGDVATLPLFPNLGLGVKTLRAELSRIDTMVLELRQAQRDLEEKFRQMDIQINEIGNASTSHSGQGLATELSLINDRTNWADIFELTRDEWRQLPHEFKIELIMYERHKNNGWRFLCSPLIFVVIFSLTNWYAFSGSDISFYYRLNVLLTVTTTLTCICGLIVLVLLIPVLPIKFRRPWFLRMKHAGKSLTWENYRELSKHQFVLKAIKHRWIEVYRIGVDLTLYKTVLTTYAVLFILGCVFLTYAYYG